MPKLIAPRATVAVDFANGSFKKRPSAPGPDHPVEASKQFRADGGLEQTRVGRESQAVTKMSRKLRKTVAIVWPMATNEGESRLREFVPTC